MTLAIRQFSSGSVLALSQVDGYDLLHRGSTALSQGHDRNQKQNSPCGFPILQNDRPDLLQRLIGKY